MKEEDLENLGFEKTFDEDYYYLSFDFGYGLSLITRECSDQVVDGEWTVELFDTDGGPIWRDRESVESVMRVLKM